MSSIEKREYKPYVADDGEVLPYRFYRTVKAPLDGAEYKIEVDFISEPEVLERLSPEKFCSFSVFCAILEGRQHQLRWRLGCRART